MTIILVDLKKMYKHTDAYTHPTKPIFCTKDEKINNFLIRYYYFTASALLETGEFVELSTTPLAFFDKFSVPFIISAW